MPVRLEVYTSEFFYKAHEIKQWTFPGGERGVSIIKPESLTNIYAVEIICNFHTSDDIVDVILLNNALLQLRQGFKISLYIPYFPYARQDRVMNPGDSFSLQAICTVLNSCNFSSIKVLDPHSDVLSALFPPGVLKISSQEDLVIGYIRSIERANKYVGLVSPDGGALKKIYKLAAKGPYPVIEASKIRDVSNGNITGVTVNMSKAEGLDTLVIVDDICDGGKTFIELGKEIRKTFKGSLVLVVTHGIFSKGQEVFEGIFDAVHAVNNMEKK